MRISAKSGASLVIGEADRLFVLTGAGISVESGIPTFRGQDGLWEGHRIEEVATPEAFARDPELVWRFYSMRRAHAARCAPNKGHSALAQLEKKLGDRLMICTQNMDGLHEAAGSERVLHMHGQLFQSRCSNGKCNSEPFADTKCYETKAEISKCAECGALLRPHICWFGEMPFHMEEVSRAIEKCTVSLTIGTSGVVQPAASFVLMAAEHGAKTYYVGPEEPANALWFDEVVLGPAGERLPQLLGTG